MEMETMPQEKLEITEQTKQREFIETKLEFIHKEVCISLINFISRKKKNAALMTVLNIILACSWKD